MDPKRAVLGHFHVPWRPSRLRLWFWRIFRPAKYREWTKPISFGHAFVADHGYNRGPSAWISGHGPRQLIRASHLYTPEFTRADATAAFERYRALYPEATEWFRAEHGAPKGKP